MPMLHTSRNRDHISRPQALRPFSILLIPTLAINTDQDLSAAAFGMVDVPVVAAPGFKGDIGDEHRLFGVGQGLKEAAAGEILRKSCVRFTLPKDAAVLFLFAVSGINLLV